MKKLAVMIHRTILFCLMLFGWIAVPGGEACPEFLSLTIHDRQVSGNHSKSVRTPVPRTSMQGDTLVVDIQTELTGKVPIWKSC